MELLESEIKKAGFKITFIPPDDRLSFYRAVGYQWRLSGETVRDCVFEYLKVTREDVSILWMFFNNSICT